MPLIPGTRLGPYEIVAPLGAGGMGEVYRAKDTRLGRDVAIKVLPQHLSANPEVRARFEREAKTVSSLNHPNICTLFDVGREGDTDYLVMELVEGETLAQRLMKGALPTAEVLKLGAQIADALDRAHRAGVVHRDLKPGNVMMTKSGAKLMDFGLARATDFAGPAGSSTSVSALTHSPTIAQPLTAEGTIVGTFQFMAPEQLEGKEADTRSDLWALGCVLYEMATGRRAFEGRSQASLISSIMTGEPAPISQTSPMSPPALDQLVRGLLAKDPDERIQTAHDARLQLQWMAAGGSQSGAQIAPARRQLRWAPVLGAIGALGAFAAGAVLAPHMPGSRVAGPMLALTAAVPPGLRMSPSGGDLALSPDGGALVFVATDSLGETMLWVRPLNGTPPRRLAGTEGAFMPFWSPDARSVAFFAGDKLRRVSIAGGTPQDLCQAASGRGGAWSKQGVILFAPGAEGPIYRVSAQGGTPEAETALDTTKHEVGHRFPRMLPDGRRFFYATTPVDGTEHEIYLGKLGSKERRFVLRCDGVPELTPEGWLLYRKNGLTHAQRFDAGACRLSGRAHPLVAASQGRGFQASPSTWAAPGGLLAYVPEPPRDERLVWLDRSGREEAVRGLEAGGWFGPRFSPDGALLAVARGTVEANSSSGIDVWMVDPARGLASRFTFGPAIQRDPVWSPDGRSVLFASNPKGRYELYLKPTSGGGEPEFVARSAGLVMFPTDWTRDGRFVVFQVHNARTSSDLWLLSMDDRREAKPLLNTSFTELDPRISPDGRIMAYASNESGRHEIYAQSFPSLGSKVQVSRGGGSLPVWSGDGRELFYRGLDGSVMAVKVQTAPSFQSEPPVRLFRPRGSDTAYDVAPDGRRFVFVMTGEDPSHSAPTVLVNWTSMMRRDP